MKSDSQVCRLGKGATQGPLIKGKSQGENYSTEKMMVLNTFLSSCSPRAWLSLDMPIRGWVRACTQAQAGCGERGAG